MARKKGNDDDKDYEPMDDEEPERDPVLESLPPSATATSPFAKPAPKEEKEYAPGDKPLPISKGDPVRLLVAHYDGFQRFEQGAIVHWWSDTPPTERNACLVETEQTPLDAPAMTDGKPPDDYLDPSTGKKPVIGSV